MEYAEMLESVREEKYTGENRCGPCTVLNLVIAGLVGSAVARKSRLGGVVVVGVSVGLIYLRGYLVPGTPTLTKRYLPATVLRWFGKDPELEMASGLGAGGDGVTEPETAEREDGPTPETEPAGDEVDLESYFIDHSVLELCAGGTDLCLTDEFGADWSASLGAVDDVAGTDLADALDLDGDGAYAIAEHGDARVLRRDEDIVGKWPSQAALVADVAAASVLADRDPSWAAREPEIRGQILNGLRLFLPTCPNGEDVELTEETVESCCQSHEVVAAVCAESGDRLFEQRLDP